MRRPGVWTGIQLGLVWGLLSGCGGGGVGFGECDGQVYQRPFSLTMSDGRFSGMEGEAHRASLDFGDGALTFQALWQRPPSGRDQGRHMLPLGVGASPSSPFRSASVDLEGPPGAFPEAGSLTIGRASASWVAGHFEVLFSDRSTAQCSFSVPVMSLEEEDVDSDSGSSLFDEPC